MRSPSRTASRTLWVTKTMVRRRLLPDPFELVVQEVARDRVERAERFVHQEDVGVLGEARASATRCRMPPESSCGRLSAKPPRCTTVEQLARPRRALDLRTPRSRSASSTLPAGSEPREQRGLLEHERGCDR